MDGKEIPTCVGDYDLGEVLGRGCSCVVFRATHRRRKTVHAVKVISRSLLQQEFSLRSIEQELRLLTSLKHPNLIGYDAVIYKPDHIFIVLEHCDHDLLTEISASFLGIKKVKSYMHDLLEGLSYLHRRGIVHCDLKPENLFITADGTLKIGDLGSCIILGQTHYYTAGTIRYMAPERFLHGTNFDVKSDIWSAAIVFLEMLNVALPWDSVSDKGEMARLICDEKQSLLTDPLPTRLKEAVSRCLERNPEKRATAEELKALPVFSVDSGWHAAKSEEIARVSPFNFRPLSIMHHKSAKLCVKRGWKVTPRHFSDA